MVYKIKPLKWKERDTGEGRTTWVAGTPVNVYEIEKDNGEYDLLVNGNWYRFPLSITLAEAKQKAENNYLERLREVLEAVETEPTEGKNEQFNKIR